MRRRAEQLIRATVAPRPKLVEASVASRKGRCGRRMSTVQKACRAASSKSSRITSEGTSRCVQSVAKEPEQKLYTRLNTESLRRRSKLYHCVIPSYAAVAAGEAQRVAERSRIASSRSHKRCPGGFQ